MKKKLKIIIPCFLLLILVIILGSTFKLHKVSGSSMEGTISNGDVLIVNVHSYKYKRGDIVAAVDPDGNHVVKRVIGLPGDTVEIKNGELFVNKELVNEKYTNAKMNYKNSHWQVGYNHYFLMGDNRNISEDSRKWGTVSFESILGKVMFK